MFEGLTLKDQREFESARGWKDSYSALTYCTAEAIIWREPHGAKSVLDREVLDARRVTGAPDCVGRRQGKWGGYVKPSDPTAAHAYSRILKETFGWDLAVPESAFVGVIGPELYKATMAIKDDKFVFTVLEEQGEQTPFEAKLFSVDATGYELGAGSYLKATEDARWITLCDLIAQEGANKDYLYWAMINAWIEFDMNRKDATILHFEPGEHSYYTPADG